MMRCAFAFAFVEKRRSGIEVLMYVEKMVVVDIHIHSLQRQRLNKLLITANTVS